MTEATGNVVLISTDNVRLHVGLVEEIPSHLGVKASDLDDLRPRLPEMYDDQGRPVQIVPAEGEAVKLTLVEGQKAIDTQLLRDRITLALALMQVNVHTNEREDLRSYRVPKVDGELRDVLAALASTRRLGLPNDRRGNCHDSSPHPHLPPP